MAVPKSHLETLRLLSCQGELKKLQGEVESLTSTSIKCLDSFKSFLIADNLVTTLKSQLQLKTNEDDKSDNEDLILPSIEATLSTIMNAWMENIKRTLELKTTITTMKRSLDVKATQSLHRDQNFAFDFVFLFEFAELSSSDKPEFSLFRLRLEALIQDLEWKGLSIFPSFKTIHSSYPYDRKFVDEGFTAQVEEAIKSTKYVVACVTSSYMDKVKMLEGEDLADKSCCRHFFALASECKDSSELIPLVMDSSCRNTNDWYGKLRGKVGGVLYIDYCNHDQLTSVSETLIKKYTLGTKQYSSSNGPGILSEDGMLTIQIIQQGMNAFLLEREGDQAAKGNTESLSQEVLTKLCKEVVEVQTATAQDDVILKVISTHFVTANPDSAVQEFIKLFVQYLATLSDDESKQTLLLNHSEGMQRLIELCIANIQHHYNENEYMSTVCDEVHRIIHNLKVNHSDFLNDIFGMVLDIPMNIYIGSFQVLVKAHYSASLFKKLANAQSESIPRDRFFQFLHHATDVFLTHDWGIDEFGRNNHKRVSAMNKYLQSQGVKTWFDEEQMEGDIQEKMIDGIDNTACVVVFVTKRYMEKAAGKGERGDLDNCRFEFSHAANFKGPGRMITIVVEPRCLNLNSWYGKVGSTLGGNTTIDYTEDHMLAEAGDSLLYQLRSILPGGKLIAEAFPFISGVATDSLSHSQVNNTEKEDNWKKEIAMLVSMCQEEETKDDESKTDALFMLMQQSKALTDLGKLAKIIVEKELFLNTGVMALICTVLLHPITKEQEHSNDDEDFVNVDSKNAESLGKSVRTLALQLLNDLLNEPQLIDELMFHEGNISLLHILCHPIACMNEKELASRAFRQISYSPQHKATFQEVLLSSIAALISLLQNPNGSLVVVSNILDVFMNLSEIELLLENQVLEVIVSFLEKDADLIKEKTIELLKQLSFTTSFGETVRTMESFFVALTKSLMEVAGQGRDALLTVVLNMCGNEKLMEDFLQNDRLQILLRVFVKDTQSGSDIHKELAMKIMLAVHKNSSKSFPRIREFMVQAKVFSSLVPIFQNGSIQMKQLAFEMVYGLLTHAQSNQTKKENDDEEEMKMTHEAFLHAALLPYVMALVKFGSNEVQLQAAHCLASLASNSHNIKALVDGGIVTPLHQMLKTGVETIRSCVINSLLDLSKLEVSHQSIIKANLHALYCQMITELAIKSQATTDKHDQEAFLVLVRKYFEVLMAIGMYENVRVEISRHQPVIVYICQVLVSLANTPNVPMVSKLLSILCFIVSHDASEGVGMVLVTASSTIRVIIAISLDGVKDRPANRTILCIDILSHVYCMWKNDQERILKDAVEGFFEDLVLCCVKAPTLFQVPLFQALNKITAITPNEFNFSICREWIKLLFRCVLDSDESFSQRDSDVCCECIQRIILGFGVDFLKRLVEGHLLEILIDMFYHCQTMEPSKVTSTVMQYLLAFMKSLMSVVLPRELQKGEGKVVEEQREGEGEQVRSDRIGGNAAPANMIEIVNENTMKEPVVGEITRPAEDEATKFIELLGRFVVEFDEHWQSRECHNGLIDLRKLHTEKDYIRFFKVKGVFPTLLKLAQTNMYDYPAAKLLTTAVAFPSVCQLLLVEELIAKLSRAINYCGKQYYAEMITESLGQIIMTALTYCDPSDIIMVLHQLHDHIACYDFGAFIQTGLFLMLVTLHHTEEREVINTIPKKEVILQIFRHYTDTKDAPLSDAIDSTGPDCWDKQLVTVLGQMAIMKRFHTFRIGYHSYLTLLFNKVIIPNIANIQHNVGFIETIFQLLFSRFQDYAAVLNDFYDDIDDIGYPRKSAAQSASVDVPHQLNGYLDILQAVEYTLIPLETRLSSLVACLNVDQRVDMGVLVRVWQWIDPFQSTDQQYREQMITSVSIISIYCCIFTNITYGDATFPKEVMDEYRAYLLKVWHWMTNISLVEVDESITQENGLWCLSKYIRQIFQGGQDATNLQLIQCMWSLVSINACRNEQRTLWKKAEMLQMFDAWLQVIDVAASFFSSSTTEPFSPLRISLVALIANLWRDFGLLHYDRNSTAFALCHTVLHTIITSTTTVQLTKDDSSAWVVLFAQILDILEAGESCWHLLLLNDIEEKEGKGKENNMMKKWSEVCQWLFHLLLNVPQSYIHRTLFMLHDLLTWGGMNGLVQSSTWSLELVNAMMNSLTNQSATVRSFKRLLKRWLLAAKDKSEGTVQQDVKDWLTLQDKENKTVWEDLCNGSHITSVLSSGIFALNETYMYHYRKVVSMNNVRDCINYHDNGKLLDGGFVNDENLFFFSGDESISRFECYPNELGRYNTVLGTYSTVRGVDRDHYGRLFDGHVFTNPTNGCTNVLLLYEQMNRPYRIIWCLLEDVLAPQIAAPKDFYRKFSKVKVHPVIAKKKGAKDGGHVFISYVSSKNTVTIEEWNRNNDLIPTEIPCEHEILFTDSLSVPYQEEYSVLLLCCDCFGFLNPFTHQTIFSTPVPNYLRLRDVMYLPEHAFCICRVVNVEDRILFIYYDLLSSEWVSSTVLAEELWTNEKSTTFCLTADYQLLLGYHQGRSLIWIDATVIVDELHEYRKTKNAFPLPAAEELTAQPTVHVDNQSTAAELAAQTNAEQAAAQPPTTLPPAEPAATVVSPPHPKPQKPSAQKHNNRGAGKATAKKH